MTKCLDWFDAVVLVIGCAIVFGLLGSSFGSQAERNEWAAGRRRVEAGQVQVWHAPLKPGDAGWWEKP